MPLTLRLGTYLLQPPEDEERGLLQSAVSLLRTVFEDHHVDPDHQSALFFHGRTLPGGPYDFSVIHRGDLVILRDFTFEVKGPRTVKIPLLVYAREVAQFARQATLPRETPLTRPEWQQRYVESLRSTANELMTLAERLITEGQEAFPKVRAIFQERHGAQKRPLELQIRQIAAPHTPWQPVPVVAKAVFGPLRLNERIPFKLNSGDTILATVEAFKPEGIHLTLEGIGHGGIGQGDRLIGLQLFYP